METSDTIVALATPPGVGALALIRVSGPDAIQLFKGSIAEKEALDRTSSRYMCRNETAS